MVKGMSVLGTVLVIAGLIAIGMLLGQYLTRRQYRNLPSNEQLRLANYIYQQKCEDYKTLCNDARNQATTLALLAQSIHKNNPSEASGRIIQELDQFIINMNGRLAAKSFTPASSELGA